MPSVKAEIPKGYQKHYIMNDNDKVYDVYYNPDEKDNLKAYLKVEVK